MAAEFETNVKHQVGVNYVNRVPCVVKEIEGYYYDHSHLELAEILQDNEGIYQSFQKNSQDDAVKASPSAAPTTNSSHSDDSLVSAKMGSHLDHDEALARALQEEEDQLAVTAFLGSTANPVEVAPLPSVESSGSTATTSAQVAREDDVDPDSMTYEELQSLGESIGAETRGLSDELISYLTTSTYKVGFFSRKEKHEECVICCMPYRNREKLMTLPCKHQYHSKCIWKWLKMNKACPVCNEEVFG